MTHYKVADTVFALPDARPGIRRRLADYETAETAELEIAPTAADLAELRTELEEPASDAYLEWLAIYRRLSDHVLNKDILLFHGSALALDGEVYLFAAPSGTGKSTHARLWRERFGDRVRMVNDDKPLLGIRDEGVTVYGTPWDGKHHLSANLALPLKALCLLERDERNHIEPIAPMEALPALLRQAYRPEALDRVLPLVTRLADAVPLYRLGCNMDPEAAEIALQGMSGGERP